MTTVEDIPVAHTPPGGYGTTMPPPVLAGCTDGLAAGAPDLRGTWKVSELLEADPAFDPSGVSSHVERIEQAGDRVVITGSGIVHDMRADGSTEHGVDDVTAMDFTTPIHVTATFEDDALVLRPTGLPGVEVRRWRHRGGLVWQYGSLFTARLERSDG